MYAIVEIAGQQFKVEEGKKIFVHRLEAEAGKQVEFNKVLLIEDDGNVTIGEPVIKDALIEGKVIDDTVRGDKVIVFKKKRKKGYRVKNGHRQNFTQVEIVSISANGSKKKSSRKAHAAAGEDPAAEAGKGAAAESHEVPAKKARKAKPAEGSEE